MHSKLMTPLWQPMLSTLSEKSYMIDTSHITVPRIRALGRIVQSYIAPS